MTFEKEQFVFEKEQFVICCFTSHLPKYPFSRAAFGHVGSDFDEILKRCNRSLTIAVGSYSTSNHESPLDPPTTADETPTSPNASLASRRTEELVRERFLWMN